MRYQHLMPFGTAIRDDGSTDFRLWAPAAARVDVVGSSDHGLFDLAMHSRGDGWFERRFARAAAGARYKFRIDAARTVPDPASRSNPDGVHAASAVVDPLAFDWDGTHWKGRAWEDAAIYELHVGTFSREGTFDAAAERLDYLVTLGVSAIELMPVAAFPGRRNWGYDAVLPFAPDASYGTPQALKRLIRSAHSRGLMVILDVVYNHFGPEGNYLHLYAPHFFSQRHTTPWGAAINFDGAHARTVRDFFIHNALYWIEEYRFDGLRLDAVHAIADDSQPDIVSEIARAVRETAGSERQVHIILENDRNEARYLGRDGVRQPIAATAQWNDDVHHAAHVLATGERDGYYADYAKDPLSQFARGLAQGFVYQGEPSAYRANRARGEPCVHLPPVAFVNFLQTHDQVGNRPFGERIAMIANPEALDALTACILLAPAPPLLFMGEEFAATTPFLFFADFGPELAEAVTKGRREEFAGFKRFADPENRSTIPDPGAPQTFERSKLDWNELQRAPNLRQLTRYRELLTARHEHIVPRLPQIEHAGRFEVQEPGLLRVTWELAAHARLHLLANLCEERVSPVFMPPGRRLYSNNTAPVGDTLERWTVVWTLAE